MGDSGTLHNKLYRMMRKNFAVSILAGLPFCLLAVWLVTGYATRNIASGMAETARDRLTLYSGSLNSALRQYSYLPHILATHPEIVRMVTQGDNEDAVNRYLLDVNSAAGSMELFVLNREGLTIASSNWNDPESFAGHDYSYRPYFQDALRGGKGGYFGVGATTGRPGFFVTSRIGGDSDPLGVAVTKVDLSMLQREWRSGGETVLITDRHGVIFLSSRDDWRYRATAPISLEAQKAMLYQRQYGGTLPPPIRVAFSRESGADVVSIEGTRWLYSRQPVNEFGWSIWFLTPFSELQRQKETLWFFGGGAVVVLFLLLLLARTYFAWARVKNAAREAEKIRAVNRRLAEEIRIRKKTEKELIAAQDDLLHASRMAALGEMAASVAHELSQPVTSMRMFASSCRRLVSEGKQERVEETIGHMLGLVDRIKALIDQLKHFSRKAPGREGAVSLKTVIDNALTVLHFKRDAAQCEVTVACPDDAVVMADALQLEQVVINLVHNALDAVCMANDNDAPGKARAVAITVTVQDGTVRLAVTDTGPGIAPDVAEQLFTPFFTTKKSGEGIGLGLAIADNIVRAMRGEITVEAVPADELADGLTDGLTDELADDPAHTGARFIVTLPLADTNGNTL